MKHSIRLLLFLFLALSLSACAPISSVPALDGPTAEPTPSSLRPTTDEKTVTMAINEHLQYSLYENASTGYHWVVTIADPSVLELEDTSYESDDAPEDWTGVGGILTLTFITLSEGETEFTLSYQRDDQDVDKAYRILVIVH